MMEMEEEQLFRWEKAGDGIRITGCLEPASQLVVPCEIAGLPVVQIGDYAFQGLGILEEVVLPPEITRLGDHAFFNCLTLKKLTAADGLTHAGDGAFKNCDNLSELILHIRQGKASALRLMISDILQDLKVRLFYEEADTKSTYSEQGYRVCENTKEACLMFPAFYFDYIENYPARIFEEIIYGAGQAYRRCFRGGDVDYEAYDRLFERSQREDSRFAVIWHAAGRLSCPYRLSEGRKREYEEWLREHGEEFLQMVLKEEEMELLEEILNLDLFDEMQTISLLGIASASRKVEYINLLMAYQGRRFAGKSRRNRYLL